MDNPFDFFESIYCINLDARKDRWTAMQHQFADLEIASRVVRFPGLPSGPLGPGCARSHLSIIEKSRREGRANVLVLEDDVKFIYDTLDIMGLASEQLKSVNWHMLYLGALPEPPQLLQRISNNLVRIESCLTTHAVCYTSDSFDYLLENYDASKSRLDYWLRDRFQPHFNCYGVNPLIATQSPDYSDNRKRSVDYTAIEHIYRECTIHLD